MVVPGCSTAPNLFEPFHLEQCRAKKVCRGLSPGFGVAHLYWAFSAYSFVGFGWFTYTEPSLTASSQGEHGVEGNFTIGGSAASNP